MDAAEQNAHSWTSGMSCKKGLNGLVTSREKLSTVHRTS